MGSKYDDTQDSQDADRMKVAGPRMAGRIKDGIGCLGGGEVLLMGLEEGMMAT